MKPTFAKTLIALILPGLLMGSLARADVKPAALFSDHMVLQKGMAIPVWGWADPGEGVTVTVAGQSQTTTTGPDRKWMLRLPELKSAGLNSADPLQMTITGKNTIVIHDVLLGEVWLGSGQSNMEFTVSKLAKRFAGVNDEEKEIAAANYPTIRMFTVKMWLSDVPLDDCQGTWEVCTPQTVPAFSAVGYFFARQLQQAIHQPIGFINASYGASVAQAWISKTDLEQNPKFKFLLDDLDKQKIAYEQYKTAPTPASQPAGRKAKSPGNPLSNHSPYMLWNAMLHPVQPYAIRGALWYQGESIIGGVELYPELMNTLITTWRKQWGQGDFPFYFVQLASLDAASNKPEVREAQAAALSLPKTAMAVTIDIGDKKNVHPKNKQDLGDRLAKIARAKVYNEPIEYSGPVYESMTVSGQSIRVKFSHIGSGLMAKDGPLKTFEIAGKDGKFVPASANIDGDCVVIQAEGISELKSVRYAWNRWPEGCNFYNKEGLPAPPFHAGE